MEDVLIKKNKTFANLLGKFVSEEFYISQYGKGGYQRIPLIISALLLDGMPVSGRDTDIWKSHRFSTINRLIEKTNSKTNCRTIKIFKDILQWLNDIGDIKLVYPKGKKFQDLSLNEFFEVSTPMFKEHEVINKENNEIEKLRNYIKVTEKTFNTFANLDDAGKFGMFNLFCYIKREVDVERSIRGKLGVKITVDTFQSKSPIRSAATVKKYTENLMDLGLIYFDSLKDLKNIKSDLYFSAPKFFITTNTPRYIDSLNKAMSEYEEQMKKKGFVISKYRTHDIDKDYRSAKKFLLNMDVKYKGDFSKMSRKDLERKEESDQIIQEYLEQKEELKKKRDLEVEEEQTVTDIFIDHMKG